MKKVLIIAGFGFAFALVFLGALVVFIRANGGASSAGGGLARVPLVGAFLQPQSPAETTEDAEGGAENPESQAAPGSLLHAASQGPLEELVGELERRKAGYDSALQRLQRREREAEAWQAELKRQREALQEHFGKQRAELVELRDDVSDREARLKTLRVIMVRREEINLKKTADIYAKMDAEKAAEILQELYAKGEADTVVKIIYLMQDRSAAKTLAAFRDPKIGAEITDRLRRVSDQTTEES